MGDLKKTSTVSRFWGRHSAELYMSTGAVMISFSGVWVKFAHVPATVSAFYRVLIGGIFLLAAALWRRELKWHGWYFIALGFACGLVFALDLVFYHKSILYIGPGLATILPNFQVFLLVFYGILFAGEKVRPRFFGALPLVFAGLFLIVGLDWPDLDTRYRTGVYLGLAAAFCYAGFVLILRRLQTQQDGTSIFLSLMLVSFTTAIFLGGELRHANLSLAVPDLSSAVSLVVLGLFSQAVGWIMISNALPRIRPSSAGLILLLQPSLAFVWDVLLFQRPTTPVNWLGVGMTLTAIYLGLTSRRLDPVTTEQLFERKRGAQGKHGAIERNPE